MLKGFKNFLLRGNIVELATAVVIGTAFTAVVTRFTQAIINPILARIGGINADGLGVQLGRAGDPSTFMDFGAVLTAISTFVITAAVVYFIFVVPTNTLTEFRKKDLKPAAAAPTDNELLLQIRDLLRAQQESRYVAAVTSGTTPAAGPVPRDPDAPGTAARP